MVELRRRLPVRQDHGSDRLEPAGDRELPARRRPAPRDGAPARFAADQSGRPGRRRGGLGEAGRRRFGSSLRSAYDLVGWDPRGTGDSAPVRCLTDQQLDAYYSTDATPDDPSEVQALVREQRVFADACKANTGAILDHLDTISTVHDMDLVRAVLGDKVLSYYGASYGTYLGAWYAQEFPWRVGRIVLDAAVDPSLTSAQYAAGQALGFSRAVRSYVQDCLSHDGCPLSGTVDDGIGQISDLLQQADSNPLPTASGRKLDQTLMATGLARGMYEQSSWPTVGRAITQAMRGDGSTLLALSDAYFERDKDGHYAQDMTSYSPIYCLDHPEKRTVAQIGEQAASLQKQYPPLGGFIGWGQTSCQVWPLARRHADATGRCAGRLADPGRGDDGRPCDAVRVGEVPGVAALLGPAADPRGPGARGLPPGQRVHRHGHRQVPRAGRRCPRRAPSAALDGEGSPTRRSGPSGSG